MDDQTPGRRHLIGVDGPEVRIPAIVAFYFEKPLREWLEAMQAGGATARPLIPYVDAMTAAARWYVADQQRASARGTGAGDDTPTGETIATRWLTTKEAAKEIGCTPRHVRNLAERGQLPNAERVGRDWRIDAASLPPHRRSA